MQPQSSRSFVTSPYLFGSGKPKVAMQPDCRCTALNSDGPCKFHIKDYRSRDVGPRHLLVVLKCVVHIICFTVYPLGWIPYGRKRLDNDGIFEAVTAAASDLLWKSQDEKEGRETSKTQWRRIQFCARLLGLDQCANKTTEIAHRLDISPSELITVNQKIREGPKTRKDWGVLTALIINRVPKRPDPVHNWLWCGKVTGFWGNIINW